MHKILNANRSERRFQKAYIYIRGRAERVAKERAGCRGRQGPSFIFLYYKHILQDGLFVARPWTEVTTSPHSACSLEGILPEMTSVVRELMLRVLRLFLAI